MGCLVKGYLSLNNSKSKTPGLGGLRSLPSGVTGFSSSGGAGMVLECGCKEKPGRVIIGKTRDATTASAAHREILFNLFIIEVFAHVSRLAAPRSRSFRVLQGLDSQVHSCGNRWGNWNELIWHTWCRLKQISNQPITQRQCEWVQGMQTLMKTTCWSSKSRNSFRTEKKVSECEGWELHVAAGVFTTSPPSRGFDRERPQKEKVFCRVEVKMPGWCHGSEVRVGRPSSCKLCQLKFL